MAGFELQSKVMAMGCGGLNHKKGIISLSILFKKRLLRVQCDEEKLFTLKVIKGSSCGATLT